MTSHPLHELIGQIRNSIIAFPLPDEQSSGTVSMKSYSVMPNEFPQLRTELEETLSFASSLENVQHWLKTQVIKNNNSLAVYTRNLHQIFSGYSKEGPYDSRCFTRILPSLNSFQRKINAYIQRDMDTATNLSSLLNAGEYKARFENDLREYYHVFNDFLQLESTKKQGANVITRSEKYLIDLTNMIRQTISLSRTTQIMLDELKNKQELAQKQILYN